MPRTVIRTHPGEVLLEDCLKPLNMSAREFGEEIGVQARIIRDITAERRPVTADLAHRIARYFGTTAEFWMGLQTDHDLSKALAENAWEYRKIKPRKREEAA